MRERCSKERWRSEYCSSACVCRIVGVNKELRVLIHSSSFNQCVCTLLINCLYIDYIQAVRKKGVEPQWVGPGISKTDKGLVYVVDNFDCSDFKLLLGKCR